MRDTVVVCVSVIQFKTPPPLPSNTTKAAYGRVAMTTVGTVTDLLGVLSDSPPVTTHNPVNMEQRGQACLAHCFSDQICDLFAID